MNDEVANQVRSRTGTLLRSNEGLRAEVEQLRSENQALKLQSHHLEAKSHTDRQSRLAALSLMEDAVHARREAEASEVREHEVAQNLMAAEEQLRLLVESAHDHAIIGMDLNRIVTSWNLGAEKLTGYKAAEMVGQVADLIFTLEDRAAGVPEQETRQAAAKGRASDKRWKQRKDGSRFWASGSMLPMRLRPDGPIVGFVKIAHDETDVHEARRALEKSEQKLTKALKEADQARADSEEANKAKDDFFAILSHELRTPLTPVLLAAQILLRRTDIPQDVSKSLEMIRRNVELESHLVNDLLDITRATRGKLEMHRRPMDMHETIAHAVEICRPDFEAKNQTLTLSLEAKRFQIEGDNKRLQQVIWNLLKNASKFTPEKGEARIQSIDIGNNLVIEVSDTGIGIDSEALTTIFDPFSQASNDISRQFGGLGLGLAIAMATVVGHGGNLSAKSRGSGQGSTFTVELRLP